MGIFKKKQTKKENIGQVSLAEPNEVAGNDKQEEIAAAIGVALYLYDMKMREDENAIITIQKIMKPYSPWSSKIYGLREQPIRIPGLRSRMK